MTYSLFSIYGNFRVLKYNNQGNANDVHRVVFFYNIRSHKTFQIHGTLALNYLSRLTSQGDVSDFPIDDDRPQVSNKDDQISRLSQYALKWNHATNLVETIRYKEYVPVAKTALIVCSEEMNPGWKDMDLSNWKKETVSNAAKGVGCGLMGCPRQISQRQLFGNLSISGV